MNTDDCLCTAVDTRLPRKVPDAGEPEYVSCPNQKCEVTGRCVTHYQYRDGTRWCIDYGCKGCDEHCPYCMC